MSASDNGIKVVKRKERELDPARGVDDLSFVKTERQVRREMVQTVGSWIVERREVKKRSYRKDLMVATICKISADSES